jgi:glucose uptake protein GlcU
MLCLLLQMDSVSLDKLGTTALLAVIVGVLWKAYQAKDAAQTKAMEQLSQSTEILKDVPAAMDRLRTEVLAKLDAHVSR